ncbi:MAG: TonB family protein [Alphaproteobacteria bacterium]
MSISAETSADVLPLDHVLGPPLRDNWAGWRRAVALACAVLLHASVIGLLLLGSPFAERAAEPPLIPVELVLLPEQKPPPKPKPKPEVAVKPAPEPEAQQYRESGGDPNLAPGRLPDAAPQPQPKPEPAPAALAEKPPPSLASAPPLPVPPPHERPKASEAVAAVAPTHQSTIEPMNDSAFFGKGGGDRYLNKMRDKIHGNFIYPGAARSRGIAGVAHYAIVIDRRGNLLELRLLHSSGADILDRAGRDAVELSAPFDPPPADVPGDQVSLELTLPMGLDVHGVQ